MIISPSMIQDRTNVACTYRYLMFAAVFITVISIRKQIEEHAFTAALLFTNKLFFTLIVSMCSTYLLYFLMSILFFDPWHMVTSVSFTTSISHLLNLVSHN